MHADSYHDHGDDRAKNDDIKDGPGRELQIGEIEGLENNFVFH